METDYKTLEQGFPLWRRILVLIFGTFAYIFSQITIVHYVGTFGGFFQLGKPRWQVQDIQDFYAILINCAVISVFVIQHRIMARFWFKTWFAQKFGQELVRPTFVLLSALLVNFTLAFWQTMPKVIWQLEEESIGWYIMWGLFWFSWLYFYISTFILDHFFLYGLKQVWYYFRDRQQPPPPFRTTGTYAIQRQPPLTGEFCGVWFLPTMTLGQLVLTICLSFHILYGIRNREKELSVVIKDKWEDYCKKVGGSMIPFLKG